MRLVPIVLALVACGEVRQHHRWPDHRREKDAEIAAIVQQTQTLEQRAKSLEARVRQLEEELAKRRATPPALAPAEP